MKKLLFSIAIVAFISSCKKEDVKPCPTPVTPVYSDTKYYLTNPSGRGERDTITFFGLTDMTPLLSSFSGTASIDISGPELSVYYESNGIMYYEGSGMFGDKELNILWYSANIDTTGVQSLYSVYSKCRIN